MYYVYILKSQKDFKYYIGVTNNFNKRFSEHNKGLSKSTKHRQPFILVRLEKYPNIESAYQRERFLKKKKSAKIIKKICND
ncbi:MAG: GIY-YIG nuclease family protein [Patescibacteria group bacterium]|nr:GIY-YIG nuclease family protein [Patescibacteria group bacterium]